jgi:PilZ domain
MTNAIAMDAASEPPANPPDQRVLRRHERIYDPFPVTIRSVDASGEAFECHTVLDNFSASGFYARLQRPVMRGTKLFAVVHLSTSRREGLAPRVAVRGVVLRVEPRSDVTWGVAVRFTHYRFL